MTLVRPLTSLKMTVQLLHVAPLPQLCLLREEGSRELAFGHVCPVSQLLASEIEQTFLYTNLTCLLAFEQ